MRIMLPSMDSSIKKIILEASQKITTFTIQKERINTFQINYKNIKNKSQQLHTLRIEYITSNL